MSEKTGGVIAERPRIARPPARLLALVLAVLVLGTGLFAIAGGTPWPVIGLAFVACLLAIGMRVGYLLALALSVLVAFGVITASLLVSAAIWASILPSIGVTFVALGWVACVAVSRAPLDLLRRSSPTWRDAVSSCAGLVVWSAALVISVRVPLVERLGWVMRNDSMNNLIFAHYALATRGIVLRADLNPTPLPASMIALGIIAGRPSSSPQMSLHHDLIGMGLTWAALVALTTVMMGLTASALVRKVVGSGIASHLAGVAGSVMVLSWYITGYPIEYGFLNLDLILPILLASLLLALGSDRIPWLSVSGLLLAATLTLATWSPLVVVPLALWLVTVIRTRAVLRRSSRIGIVVMAIALLQFLAYGILGVLPTYLQQRSALAGAGGIYSANYYVVFVAGAAVVALGFFVFRANRGAFVAITAVVASSWIVVGLLLFISRRNPSPWTYYPIKVAYFSTVLFLVMVLGLAIAFFAQHARRALLRRIGGGVIALLVIGLIVATPSVDRGLVRMNPLLRLTVSHPSEKYVQPEEIVQALASSGQPSIVWESGLSDESYTNLWLLQLRADTLSATSRLRLAGYNQLVDHSTKSLCDIVRLTGSATVIYTNNTGLRAKMATECPGVSAHFAHPPTTAG